MVEVCGKRHGGGTGKETEVVYRAHKAGWVLSTGPEPSRCLEK